MVYTNTPPVQYSGYSLSPILRFVREPSRDLLRQCLDPLRRGLVGTGFVDAH